MNARTRWSGVEITSVWAIISQASPAAARHEDHLGQAGDPRTSAWLARCGPAVGRVDITPAQLESARRCQDRFGALFPLIEAGAGDVPLPSGSFGLAISGCGASLVMRPGPPVLYGVPGDAGSAQFAALMRIACSDRHQSAPGATVSAHPGVSNEKPNAPLETCTRARRTPTSARQSRSDLTECPGAPKARALAKLRYSPWRNYSSASAPLLPPAWPNHRRAALARPAFTSDELCSAKNVGF